jgi:hypothetical protein
MTNPQSLTAPRADLSLVADIGTARRMALAMLAHLWRGRLLVCQVCVLALVPLVVHAATQSLRTATVTAFLAAALTVIVMLFTGLERYRASVPPGGTVFTGYRHGRWLLSARDRDVYLGPGQVTEVRRTGSVALIHRRDEILPLLVPGELVTPEDVQFLTRPAAGPVMPDPASIVEAWVAGQAASTGAAAAPSTEPPTELPYAVTIGAAEFDQILRAARAAYLRSTGPRLQIAEAVLIAALSTWRGFVPGLALAAVVAWLTWLGWFGQVQVLRRATPIGTELRAGLTEDSLVVATPTGTTALRYSAIRDIHVVGHAVAVRPRRSRIIALPLVLLPADARFRLQGQQVDLP